MFKLLFCIAALLVTSVALAQNTEGSPRGPAVEAVLGLIKERTDSADQVSDFCRLNSSAQVPSGAMVVVVRKVPCESRYGATFSKEFLEVIFAGKTRLVPVDAVFLSDASIKKFAAMVPAEIESSIEDWRLTSLLARRNELEQAIKALDATSKHGVALLKAGIFDVSEYTEGTGFEVSVYNSTKKTIKYVTFTVVGLNAVGDPVRGLSSRSGTAMVLRGIGPIEPGESGAYSKDYMWLTDVVESFRISSIKLEYTDGSSKVVSDVKRIRISPQDYETLTTGTD